MYTLLPNFHVPKPVVHAKKPVAFGAGQPEPQYVGTEETRKFIPRITEYLAQRFDSKAVQITRRKNEQIPPKHTKHFHVYAITQASPPMLGIKVPIMENYGESGTYHGIYQDGTIHQNGVIDYTWGGQYKLRERVENHFADLLYAIREERTEPRLPKWLASEEAQEKFTPKNIGKAWGEYIPPDHLRDENLAALDKTLHALRALALTRPRKQQPWEKHHALPGVEQPSHLRLSTRLAGDFQTAADTLETSLCSLGNMNREAVRQVCKEAAKTLSGSHAKTEEVAIKASLQEQIGEAISHNNDKYAPYLVEYKVRRAQQEAEAQALQLAPHSRKRRKTTD